jgi:hypothetical protein
MNKRNAIGYLLCAAISCGVFAGCNAVESQPGFAPIASLQSSNTQQTFASLPAQSWVSAKAKVEKLIYVDSNNPTNTDVNIYSYKTGKKEGTLAFTGPQGAGGLCSDARGDVFVALYGSGEIMEFAHAGKTPIATFDDSGWRPFGCAVDRETGDLAVTNLESSSGGPGSVTIYKHGKGTHSVHALSAAFYFYDWCSYDNRGNLFVDGVVSPTSPFAFAFAELAKGGHFYPIQLDEALPVEPNALPGGVQWDGQHITVANPGSTGSASSIPSVVYQFTFKSNVGTTVGSTSLGSASNVYQYWIDGKTVLALNGGPLGATPTMMFYGYPAGGAARKQLPMPGSGHGMTVSL